MIYKAFRFFSERLFILLAYPLGVYVMLVKRRCRKLKIHEVSKLTNLAQKTIRYYEERGLINPEIKVIRNRNFRDYSEQTVCILFSISTLRKLLFSIDEIKTMMDQPAKMSEILTAYESRIRKEAKQRAFILSNLSGIKENYNIKDIDSLSKAFNNLSQNFKLPLSDVYPNFSHLDSMELKYSNQKERLIYTKHSIFVKRINAIELLILDLLCKNKNMDFTTITHRCMERGVFSDSDVVYKTLKRMSKRKLIQYKEGSYIPLVSSSHLEFRNFDSVIQTAYNGSPSMMMYTPPSTIFGTGTN